MATPTPLRPDASAARKSALSIAVHWLSALAVLLAFALAWARELTDNDAVARSLLAVHRQIGLMVLCLLAVRLWLRWRDPAASARLPAGLRWAAHATHGLLYGLLATLPLLGWAMTSAQGHPLRLWGALPLPALTAVDPDLADALQQWHERAAWGLLTLVLLHAAAALWHHFVRRDDVLASIWPARARPK